MSRILLCNDDGYRAQGLQVLEKVLTTAGHEVFVVAPHEERSGQSHAMSFFSPVHVRRVRENTWAVKGTPADCAAIALNDLLKENPPDLVVSGINHGYNVGWDVHYSGTVGAATEAVFLGFQAIAVSMNTGIENLEQGFEETARLVENVLHAAQNQSMTWPEKNVLNINHPGVKPKGVVATVCRGDSLFEPGLQKFEMRSHPNSQDSAVYILGGNAFKASQLPPEGPDDDVSLTTSGNATLTFLNIRQGSESSRELLVPLCKSLSQ